VIKSNASFVDEKSFVTFFSILPFYSDKEHSNANNVASCFEEHFTYELVARNVREICVTLTHQKLLYKSTENFLLQALPI